MVAQILVTGQVQTTSIVNLRQGEPSTTAPLLRKAQTDTSLPVFAIVAGEAVQGNSLWYRIAEEAFAWSGGCGPFTPGPAASTAPQTGTPVIPIPAIPFPPAVPLVLDIYHGDVVTSFPQAFAAGVRGIIHKATTGGTGRDDLYDHRRTAAMGAGMLWGAYHWGTAAPAQQQVENFLSWAKPDDKTLVALDYETTNGNQMTLDNAREFLTLIERKLGRKAVIYSGNLIKSDLGTRVDPFFRGPPAGARAIWPDGGRAEKLGDLLAVAICRKGREHFGYPRRFGRGARSRSLQRDGSPARGAMGDLIGVTRPASVPVWAIPC